MGKVVVKLANPKIVQTSKQFRGLTLKHLNHAKTKK